jgi:hypothetical protein
MLALLPGPLSAVTLPAATAAIAAGIGKLGLTGAAGALLGKPAGRLLAIAGERLFEGPEFNAFRVSAEGCRGLLEEHAASAAGTLIERAQELVLKRDDPLLSALERFDRQEGRAE